MTSVVVIDASAAVEIALQTHRGRALVRLLPHDAVLWAPEHIFAEMGSALRRLEIVEHRVDAVTARSALDTGMRLIRRRVSLRNLIDEAWQLRFNVALADALYVVVAQHLAAPLLTADRRLASTPALPVDLMHIGPA